MPTPSPPEATYGTELTLPGFAAAPRLLNRIFWSFQCLFWLLIAALAISMSRAVDPAAPIAWTTIGFRITSGFAVTAAVYLVFQQPRLRRVGRPLRWFLICLATAGLLVGSLLPLSLWDVTTSMVWMGTESLGQIVPRLAAGMFWCTGYFALELADGLYASDIRLAQAAAEAAGREARAMQLEATAFEHEVHRLQAQMNPHFLFNALNAIVACKDSPEDVARVTQDLLSTFSDTAPGRPSRLNGSP